MSDEKYVTKITAACLLGDGYVGVPPDGSVNACFVMNMCRRSEEHIDYVASVLSNVTKVRKYYYTSKVGDKDYPGVRIVTRTHPFFTAFRNRMYGTGVKTVDPHYLTLLDPEFLAVWYMQDGSICRIKNENLKIMNRIELCTDSFSYADNHLLRNKMAAVLNLHWSVRRKTRKTRDMYYNLELSTKCFVDFVDMVKPFVQPCFTYKITLAHRTPAETTLPDGDIVRSPEKSGEVGRNDQPLPVAG